jgi:hypothetical protein
MKVAGCQPSTPAAFTPQEIFLVIISVKRLGWPQGRIVAGRIKTVKNSKHSASTNYATMYPMGQSPALKFMIIL